MHGTQQGAARKQVGAGAAQLATLLEPHGYRVDAIPVGQSLHFKSDVNLVADSTLIVTPEMAGHAALADYEQIVVDPSERYAANCVRVNEALLVPAGYPQTAEKLESYSSDLVVLDVSEARKMDGGLSCMSLRF